MKRKSTNKNDLSLDNLDLGLELGCAEYLADLEQEIPRQLMENSLAGKVLRLDRRIKYQVMYFLQLW